MLYETLFDFCKDVIKIFVKYKTENKLDAVSVYIKSKNVIDNKTIINYNIYLVAFFQLFLISTTVFLCF